jgi:hypothetical protein
LAGKSRTFGQAVPSRVAVSLVFCCLVLAGFSGYLIYEGLDFARTPLVGGYEVLQLAAPLAVFLLLVAGGMVMADRRGRDAWITVGPTTVTLHSRGVLSSDLAVPMGDITAARTYPVGFPASQLPRAAGSVTPLSMGPWLALSVAPRTIPARGGNWMWRVYRYNDFSHVRTPTSRGRYSMILFGTEDAEQAMKAIRERLPA